MKMFNNLIPAIISGIKIKWCALAWGFQWELKKLFGCINLQDIILNKVRNNF